MGDHYNGVVWAYKHIAKETCLVLTLGKALRGELLSSEPIYFPPRVAPLLSIVGPGPERIVRWSDPMRIRTWLCCTR
jgi:hypothetical protein